MIFQDIRNAMRTRLETILPVYTEFTNVFNIEDNTEEELDKGFGISWGEGFPATGPTRRVAFNQSLNVYLTNQVSVRESDDVAPEADILYNDIETVITRVLDDSCLGIPDKFRGLKAPNISSPKLIKGNTIVLIEVTFPADFTMIINYC